MAIYAGIFCPAIAAINLIILNPIFYVKYTFNRANLGRQQSTSNPYHLRKQKRLTRLLRKIKDRVKTIPVVVYALCRGMLSYFKDFPVLLKEEFVYYQDNIRKFQEMIYISGSKFKIRLQQVNNKSPNSTSPNRILDIDNDHSINSTSSIYSPSMSNEYEEAHNCHNSKEINKPAVEITGNRIQSNLNSNDKIKQNTLNKSLNGSFSNKTRSKSCCRRNQ